MEELYSYRRSLLARFAAVASDLAARHTQLSAEQPAMSLDVISRHLLEAERRVYFPAIERILGEDQPTLQVTADPEQDSDSRLGCKTGPELLRAYTELRAQEVRLLESQPPGAWGRTARHPVFGVRTLQWWVERSLKHAEEHLRNRPC